MSVKLFIVHRKIKKKHVSETNQIIHVRFCNNEVYRHRSQNLFKPLKYTQIRKNILTCVPNEILILKFSYNFLYKPSFSVYTNDECFRL